MIRCPIMIVPLVIIVEATRTHQTRCGCGWSMRSATAEGLHVLVEHHSRTCPYLRAGVNPEER